MPAECGEQLMVLWSRGEELRLSEPSTSSLSSVLSLGTAGQFPGLETAFPLLFISFVDLVLLKEMKGAKKAPPSLTRAVPSSFYGLEKDYFVAITLFNTGLSPQKLGNMALALYENAMSLKERKLFFSHY